MPAAKTPAKKTITASSAKPKMPAGTQGEDVIALLTKDHKDVKKLFTAYQKLADADAPADERKTIADEICAALTVHATVEEEIFYPAMRDAADDAEDELDEAEVEHASVKDLIAQIEEMDPDEDLYDAKVKVLGEYVDHHVKEEEGEMFPKAKKSDMDLNALGAEVQARKEELQAVVAK